MADKKKNYSKKAGGPGLMAALSDYQKEKKSGPYAPENKPKPQTSSSAPKREVRNGVIYINGKKVGYTKDHSSGSGSGSGSRSGSGSSSSSGGSSSGGSSGGNSGVRSFSGNSSGTPTRITPYRSRAQGLAANRARQAATKPERSNFSSNAAYQRALAAYMKTKAKGALRPTLGNLRTVGGRLLRSFDKPKDK